MLQELKKRLTKKRYIHSLHVANLARELAERFGEDIDKAYLAGILHDCAKNIPYEDSIKLCEEFKIELNAVEKKNPVLVHAPLGAEIAKRDFGVLDLDIYNAIKNHTVGRSGMSKLEKIIYVSDVTEKSRSFDGVEKIREALLRDLDKAVLMSLEYSLRFNLKRGSLIHIGTIEAYNDIKIRREK